MFISYLPAASRVVVRAAHGRWFFLSSFGFLNFRVGCFPVYSTYRPLCFVLCLKAYWARLASVFIAFILVFMFCIYCLIFGRVGLVSLPWSVFGELLAFWSFFSGSFVRLVGSSFWFSVSHAFVLPSFVSLFFCLCGCLIAYIAFVLLQDLLGLLIPVVIGLSDCASVQAGVSLVHWWCGALSSFGSRLMVCLTFSALLGS